MTICRMTRLSSATRIFTVAPRSLARLSCSVVLLGGGAGRSGRGWHGSGRALRGDGERPAAPQEVEVAGVVGSACFGGGADLGQAEDGRTGEDALDVASHDVGKFAEGVLDVVRVEHRRRVLLEQAPGQFLGGGAGAGEHDRARPGAHDLDPRAHGVGHRAPERGDQELLVPDESQPCLLDDAPQSRLVEQFGDHRHPVGAPPALAGVLERRHSAAPSGSRPSSASLSRIASAVNGLMRYSCAPAASARTLWPCSLSEVTIMIVTERQAGLARTAETNRSPSITGMFQSTQTSSGTQPSSRTSRPSRPCSAGRVSYPSPSRIPETMRRMARESSITKART